VIIGEGIGSMGRSFSKTGTILTISGAIALVIVVIASITTFVNYGESKVLADNDDFIEIDVLSYRTTIDDKGMDEIRVNIVSLIEDEVEVAITVKDPGQDDTGMRMSTPVDRTFPIDGDFDGIIVVLIEITNGSASLDDLKVRIIGQVLSDGTAIACCLELLAIPIGMILFIVGITLLIVAKVQKDKKVERTHEGRSFIDTEDRSPLSSDHFKANMVYLRMRKGGISVPYICHRCHGSIDLDAEKQMLLHCPHCGTPIDFTVVDGLVDRMVR